MPIPGQSAARHADGAAARSARRKADTAKPFKGVGSGVFEIAQKRRGNAFRAIYAVQIDDAIWVVDAFQKKSTSGVKAPQVDVDRIRERLKRLREALNER